MCKKCSFMSLLISMLVLFSSCTMMTERNSGELAIKLSTAQSRNIIDELKGATYTVTLLNSDGTIFDEKTTTSNEVKFTLIPRGDYIIKLVGKSSHYYIKGEAPVTVFPGVENKAIVTVTYKLITDNVLVKPTEKGIEINLKPYWDKYPTAETIFINRTRESSLNRVDTDYITVNVNTIENDQGISQTIKEPTVTDYFVNNGDSYSYEIVVCDIDGNELGTRDKLKSVNANGGVGELKITTPIQTRSRGNGLQEIYRGKPDFTEQNKKLQTALGKTQNIVPNYITLGLCYRDDFNEVKLYDTDYSGQFDWNYQNISGSKISFVSANVGCFFDYISYEVIYDANTNIAEEKELISGIEAFVYMPTEPPVVPGPITK